MRNALIALISGGGQRSSKLSARIIWDFVGVTSRSTGRAGSLRDTAHYQKFGFTLAEVLITLGVVGVVAAMTLPTLINNQKNKELEAAFKKSYSTLSQTVQKVILDDYGGAYQASNATALINDIQKYYLKSSSCINGKKCSSSIFPIEDFSGNNGVAFISKTYKNYTGNAVDGRFNDGIIAAADGSFIYFDTAIEGEITFGSCLIGIDVNGWRKKPNRYGHDFFAFQLDSKGRLLPMGKAETFFPEDRYCSATGSLGQNGYGCTTKALSDPNYFKKLPK